jgi:hypothetical protein
VYEYACQLCPEDRPAVYIGETARNLYPRGGESIPGIMKGENQNHSKGVTNKRNIVGLIQILRQKCYIA